MTRSRPRTAGDALVAAGRSRQLDLAKRHACGQARAAAHEIAGRLEAGSEGQPVRDAHPVPAEKGETRVVRAPGGEILPHETDVVAEVRQASRQHPRREVVGRSDLPLVSERVPQDESRRPAPGGHGHVLQVELSGRQLLTPNKRLVDVNVHGRGGGHRSRETVPGEPDEIRVEIEVTGQADPAQERAASERSRLGEPVAQGPAPHPAGVVHREVRQAAY